MKQRKFGAKVQNWHRPIGRDQLKQSFRRHRCGDVPVIERDRGYDSWSQDAWGYGDWISGDWDWSEEEFPFVVHCQKVREILADCLAPTAPWLTTPDLEKPVQTLQSANCDKTLAQPWNIESKLFAFLDIATDDSEIDSLRQQIEFHTDSIEKMVDIVSQHGWPNSLAKNLCLFAPFWIRAADAFPGGSASDFVRHLLARYEIPRCLDQVWFRDVDLDELKWHSWFLLFAQGGSLSRAANMFGWSISNRLQRELLNIPSHFVLPPVQACIFAEIIVLGGSDIEFERIAANPAFVLDPTDPTTDTRELQFWKSTVRWLVKHRNEIGDEEAGLVLDWAMHQFTERSHPRLTAEENPESSFTPTFTWKGRSAKATVERSLDYLRQRERSRTPVRWQSHGWDWSTGDEFNHWTLSELTTSKQLRDEGLAMSHCVGGYAKTCANGNSAIFSMRCNDTRVLTIQINADSLQIMQAKGERNRASHVNEDRILRQWIQQIARPSHLQSD